MDEAGRGPWAGPVVAAAVIVRDFSFSSRIDDSKKMSAAARDRAFSEIVEKCAFGVGVVADHVIDKVNVLEATFLAMQHALLKLGETPDCVLVDGPYTPELSCKRFGIVDGDGLSFSIACASILAKVTRDRIMLYYDTLYPEYGFKNHKGYGTGEHQNALRRHGPCAIHRRSFKPVRLYS